VLIWLTPRRALLIGFSSILIAPWLFTRTWGFIKFGQVTGTIGDTIGGITAPITGLLGAFLVYKALKEQVVANKIITDQFKEQKTHQFLTDQVSFLRDDLDQFVYPHKDGQFTGGPAINAILTLYYKEYSNKCPEDDRVEAYSINLIQLKELLERIVMLYNQIGFARFNNADRNYFLSLIKQTYHVRIYPILWMNESRRLKRAPKCTKCGVIHQGLPEYIYGLYDKINDLFDLSSNDGEG
jgi:hypothetical protein